MAVYEVFRSGRHSSDRYKCHRVDGHKPLVLEYSHKAQAWLPIPKLCNARFETRHLTEQDIASLRLFKYAHARPMMEAMEEGTQIKLCWGLTPLIWKPLDQANSFLKNTGYPSCEPGLFTRHTSKRSDQRDYEVIKLT